MQNIVATYLQCSEGCKRRASIRSAAEDSRAGAEVQPDERVPLIRAPRCSQLILQGQEVSAGNGGRWEPFRRRGGPGVH